MYNGNISGMKWKNGGSGSTQKGYGFIYDQLNRLTTSKYGEGTSYTTNVNRYDENLTYDKNGNIRKLYRNGQISSGVFGNIDSLGYKYPGTGNQVWAIGDIVTDVAGRGDFFDGTNGYSTKEYYYDKNGNMWLDRNKKMKTLYNYLNLPSRVSDTITPANKIEYIYTSAGEKLKQRLSTGTTLLYFGNYVYTLDGTANGIAVKYILTQEGRATYSAGAYLYEYFMKDHLGNTRVSFNVPSSTAVIVQQSDYYPFGMIHQPQATTTSDNRYLYNSKEFQNNLLGGINLDLYDYRYRFYDPQISRFNSIDRLADKYPYKTPYDYAENRPIDGFDLDGLEWTPAAISGAYHPVEAANSLKYMEVDSKSQALGRKMFTASFAIAGGVSTVYAGAAWIATSGSTLSMFGGGFSMSIGTSKIINGVRTIGAVTNGQTNMVPRYVTYMGPIMESATGNETIAKYSDLAADLSTSFLGASTTPGFDLIGKADAVVTAGQLVTQIVSDLKNTTSDKSTSYQIKRGDTLTSIARENSTSVDNLVKMNNISDPDKIQAGQSLSLK